MKASRNRIVVQLGEMCRVRKKSILNVTNLVKLPLLIWKPLSISQQLLNIGLKQNQTAVNTCKRHANM